MSKNLTRKGLALVSGSALALSSLVGFAAPATAAAGDVTLAPTSGTGTSAFATDKFSLTTKVKSAVVNPTTLAYRIDNPDQAQLFIELSGNSVGRFDIIGYTAAGEAVETGDLGADLDETNIVVDFATLDITSVVIHTIQATGTGNTSATAATGNVLNIALDESAEPNASGAQTLDAPEYGETTDAVTVTVTSWVETSTTANYATVDADYASTALPVTFVDPSSVSVISRVERIASGSADSGLFKATAAAVAVGTSALTLSGMDAGQTVGGVVLADGDFVVLTAQSSAAENGLYEINADGVAPTATDTDLAATDFVLITEGTGAGSVYTGDGTNAVTAYTTSGTVVALNAGGDNLIGASLDFSNSAINLAQVDLSQWLVSVVASNTDDWDYSAATVLRPITPAGYTAVDAMGRLLVQAPVSDLSADDGASYQLKFKHSGDSVAPVLEFSSPAYQVVTSPSTAANYITAAPTDTVNTSVGTYSNGYPVSVRNGTAAVTFKATVESASGTANEVANVPVLAIVTAGANFAAGQTLQVSGATTTIKAAGEKQIVSGLTNSDGNWSVTVTSSDTSSAAATYSVQFYVLDQDTNDTWKTVDGVSSNNALFNVDYASVALAAMPDGFAADSDVLSGDKVTVSFSVADQYGEPLSASSAGNAYSVELAAPDTDDLELYAAVTKGVATFTFNNYLGAGESDVITAKLFTGTSSDPSYVSGYTVNLTLYKTNAVVGINVTDEITGVEVSYDDFITGASSSTNVAPSDLEVDGSTAKKKTIAGTVVDANGAGVPGAAVTVTADGFQLVKTGTTKYSIGSIVIAADESGSFSVDFWTHKQSSTGQNITFTSGSATARTVVKSVLPSGNSKVSVDNLKFSWNLPATLVMNTTYAVTATLADKWGNPVSGAVIGFNGYAAAQFNGVSTEVEKTTDKNGQATVYLRSLKDTDGISAVGATFKSLLGADSTSDLTTAVGAVRTDDATTAWDESKWTNVIEAQVNFLKTAPAGTPGAGKVNVGSFNGKLVVYASGLNGATISWKVGGTWGKQVATSNYAVFNRPTPRAGVTVSVDIYVNGVKTLTKSVVTR